MEMLSRYCGEYIGHWYIPIAIGQWVLIFLLKACPSYWTNSRIVGDLLRSDVHTHIEDVKSHKLLFKSI